MAMSDDEKSVQGIKDPAARKAAFYTKQRESANSKVNSLNPLQSSKDFLQGKQTQDKIYGKLKGGKALEARAKDAVGNVANAASAVVPETKLGKLAGAASKMNSMVPEIEEVGSKALSGAKAAGSKMAKYFQDLGRAKPVAQKATSTGKAAMKNVTPKAKALSGGDTKALTGKTTKALGDSKPPNAANLAKKSKFNADGSRNVSPAPKRVQFQPAEKGGKTGLSQATAKKMSAQRKAESGSKLEDVANSLKKSKAKSDAKYAKQDTMSKSRLGKMMDTVTGKRAQKLEKLRGDRAHKATQKKVGKAMDEERSKLGSK